MTVRKILRMGDPFLLQPAAVVSNFDTPQLHQLVQDLFDTMQAANGAGIAAPQIGEGFRVVVFGFETNARYPNRPPVPTTVLINPVIEPLSDVTDEDWEGCLSVPGLRGKVPRYTHIRYCGCDQFGVAFEREVRDFHARVVQHECDHLDGVLFPMRVRDMTQFGYLDELLATKRISTSIPEE
ncbi:MAG: peptide deformylase [Gammaproteobacteria bacterium]|nr:peptide deformylase [Gammaproteobacteria bacterium]